MLFEGEEEIKGSVMEQNVYGTPRAPHMNTLTGHTNNRVSLFVYFIQLSHMGSSSSHTSTVRGGAVGIATGYWMDNRGIGVRVPVG
jgi:hypothetical protein